MAIAREGSAHRCSGLRARLGLAALLLCVPLAACSGAAGTFGAPKRAPGRAWWKPWSWLRKGCPAGHLCGAGSPMRDLSVLQFNMEDIPRVPLRRWTMDTAGLFTQDFLRELHENITEFNESTKTGAYLVRLPESAPVLSIALV
mmetsp:Transcript_15548/g.36941  ORF Transcript_15548/g.36941 Transcript_15548/m.36941 type:complete len:144 (+) Transcript_15548:24-455(+)